MGKKFNTCSEKNRLFQVPESADELPEGADKDAGRGDGAALARSST